jgi:hypothetical protein
MAIFLIAVHFAKSVWGPHSGGLEPYRHCAYALWVIFPILVSSLIYAATHDAYKDVGQFCYLPPLPSWYRLVFNWIPRYIIFITILSLCVCLYIYVGNIMKKSSIGSSGSSGSDASKRSRHSHNALPLPRIAHHGLLSQTTSNFQSSSAPATASPTSDMSRDAGVQGPGSPANNASLRPVQPGSRPTDGQSDAAEISRLWCADTVQPLDQALAELHMASTSNSEPLQPPPPVHTEISAAESHSDTQPTPCSWRSVFRCPRGLKGLSVGFNSVRSSTS